MLEKYKCILRTSTVLLAEDDCNLRESFAKVLSLYMGTILKACDGEDAYHLYKHQHPDILITDIKMPKINGLELIKQIRKENAHLPIIVTSAYSDKDFLFESIKLSLIDYVVKPIRESELKRLLEQCAKILEEKGNKIVALNSNYAYNYSNKTMLCNNVETSLTNKEVEFLEILLSHKGSLVTRQILEDKLYVYEEAPPSALKNLVFKLRKKMGSDIVKTVGNLGYAIKE